MTQRELRDFLPFIAVDDGAVFSKRGDITFGWQVWLPTAYTVNEAGYDGIIGSLLQAFKVLPDFAILHKQDVFCNERYQSPEGGFFLEKSYFRHFQGRQFLNGRCYLYLTFSDKNNVMRESKESGFLGTHDSKRLSEDYIQRCFDDASKFEAIFGANPLIYLQRMKTEDFLRMDEHGQDQGTIADYMRFYDSDSPDYNWRFHPRWIDYGDKVAKMWYVEDSDAYPATVSSVSGEAGLSGNAARVFLSGGSPIGYRLRIPHVVNRYIVKMKKGIIENELELRKRVMVSFSGYSSENRVNAGEIQTQIERSADNNAILVKCFTDLMAWGAEEEMAGITNAVTTAFRSGLDMAIVEEEEKVGALWYAAIPGAAAELGYECYINSEIVSFMCHGLWDGYDYGMSGGLVNVCDRRCRVPVKIDLQEKARDMGYTKAFNMLVIGPTGSGKSFTMNSLVQDWYVAGEHTVIIDIGKSYQGICRLVNELSGGRDGIFNDYDPKHPFSFNPFFGRKHWDDVDAEGEKTGSGMDFFLSLVKTIYQPEGGWKNESSAALSFLIDQFLRWWDDGVPADLLRNLKEAYENERRLRAKKAGKAFDASMALDGFKDPVGMIFGREERSDDPLFDDFYQFVTLVAAPLQRDGSLKMGGVELSREILHLDLFGAAMDMYRKGGKYGFLLNAEQQDDLFSSRLTVFEVDQIKDNQDLFPLWVLCIMHSFEDKMRGLRCHKNIVIEEAWKALDTPSMEGFIRWLWRTSRKFNTSAVVVSQNASDLTVSDVVRDAIIPNTDIRIILDQRGNEDSFMNSVPALSLSPMATNLVLSINSNKAPGDKSKEVFIQVGPDYSNVFNVEVSLEQALCFETNQDDKKGLFESAERLGSFRKAIEYEAAKIRGYEVKY